MTQGTWIVRPDLGVISGLKRYMPLIPHCGGEAAPPAAVGRRCAWSVSGPMVQSGALGMDVSHRN